jgi:hypothetical protein
MKIRSSDHASAIDASSGLELAVWTQFSRKYGRRLSIGNTGKIWRVDTFDANDPVQLSNLLEQTELWVCDHTKQPASVSWPPPVLGSKLGVDPCTVIRVLSSMGALDLHVITVNLENITSNPDSTIALQHVPNIENVSFHVAMSRTYSDLLDIHGGSENTFPLRFNLSIGQLASSLRQLREHESNGTVLELQTDLNRWVYATRVLYRNKHRRYQTTQARGYTNPQCEASL